MAHKQHRIIQGYRSFFIVSLTLALIFLPLISNRTPVSYAYNADATSAMTGLAAHSSFHYEMVRVLAVLAGFTKDEAEQIGVAGEAVDLGTFTGYPLSNGAKTIVIQNTGRFSPNGLLYHFARRSAQYTQANAQGSQANTCEYFKNGSPQNRYTAPCTDRGPELDQIRNWAFALDGPKPTANQLPRDSKGKPIPPKSLIALGIYVHSIGDSYSHEKCMIGSAWRFHKPSPFDCNVNWHTAPTGDFGEGTPFTKPAADEVWKALRQFRNADGSNPPDFIKDFIATKVACDRVKFAVDKFNSLTQETTSIKCTAAKTSAKTKQNN
jgi:hypothetical protein